ncbi:MAG: hypothetical protein GWP38_10220 [Planctomycetia bacterium]|nr:hypothetical protein [Planctomycetia bacterium]
MFRNFLPCLILIGIVGCAPIKTEIDFVSPAPGSTAELINFSIEVGFDHKMDLATFTNETFIVSGSTSGAIEGIFSTVGNSRQVTFSPAATPVGGETITVVLTDGLSSQSGKALNPYQWQFVIEQGTLPPPTDFIVTGMTPGIEAYNSSTETTLNPILSAPYDPFSIGSSLLRVEGSRSGQRVTTLQNVFTGVNTLQIAPDRDFLAGERITLSLVDEVFGLDGSELPQTILATQVANLGFDWPGNPVTSVSGTVGVNLVFFDYDADGLDEWAEVRSDGTVIVQDSTPAGLGGTTSWILPEAIVDATAGDFDGDGRIDLACLGSSGNSIYLLKGSFSIAIVLEDPVTLGLKTDTTHIVAAHADSDGIIDLVRSGPGGLGVSWGDSSSPLSVGTTVDVTPIINAPIATDLNGDDFIDLAGVLGDGSISLFSGSTARQFASEGSILGYNLTTGIHAVNLDGDALRDLLLIPVSGGTPSALLSDGDFNFSLRVLFDDVAFPGVELLDWDGDGHLDCLTPRPGTTGLWLSLGVGDGNFTTPELLNYASQVSSISFGDTDGDGSLELALAENDGSYELLRSEPVVLSPANRIRVEDINANAGDSSVTYEVLIDCVEDLQGWTLALEFNSTIMGLNNITIDGTDAAGLVEFELPNIDNSNGTVIYANILDLAPPFDNQVLSPGSGYVVATGEAFISASAPSGSYAFGPANGGVASTSPPTNNTFVVSGSSVDPELISGTVTIGGTSGSTLPEDNSENNDDSSDSHVDHFIRGDVNGDGVIDLTDGTQLQLLIGTGLPLSCQDAADANDDGIINDDDPVFIFEFLYQGSNPPPAPFPSAGPDPTADGLDCQSGGAAT